MEGIKIIAVFILVFAVYSSCSPIDLQGLCRSLSSLFCSITYYVRSKPIYLENALWRKQGWNGKNVCSLPIVGLLN